MPMGPYSDFEDCLTKNQDKDNPEAYCGTIKKQTEMAIKTDEHGRKIIAENVPIVFRGEIAQTEDG